MSLDLDKWNVLNDGLYIIDVAQKPDKQVSTNAMFSEKWEKYSREEINEQSITIQQELK